MNSCLNLWGFILVINCGSSEMEYKMYHILCLMAIKIFCHMFILARNLDPHIPQRRKPQMSNTLHLSYLTTQ